MDPGLQAKLAELEAKKVAILADAATPIQGDSVPIGGGGIVVRVFTDDGKELTSIIPEPNRSKNTGSVGWLGNAISVPFNGRKLAIQVRIVVQGTQSADVLAARVAAKEAGKAAYKAALAKPA